MKLAAHSAFILIFVGCGGSGADIPQDDAGVVTRADAGTLDATTDAADELADQQEAGAYGEPNSTYPAFTPWMGQLTKNGGPILSAPVIVTITWDGDSGRSTFEAFGDSIGGSSYWSAAVGEWGVGPATSGTANHVHVTTTPPTTWADSDVQAFIKANLGGLLPAPTSQTIYVVYVPQATAFTFQGQPACNSIGGYHDAFAFNNSAISYAVLPRCASDSQTTSYASHEIGEASTDPEPSIQPGVLGFDDDYLAFDLWQRENDENGDACEFFKDSFYTEAQPFPYAVQRLWSNVQGPLGHSPCQPFTTTYFNVAPLELQDITLDLSQLGGPSNQVTKGYKCALNQTIQIPIGFYSDAATTGPWTVSVAESNPLVSPVTGRLTLSVDSTKTTGVNGEKTFLNVTVTQVGPINGELMTVISTLGTTKHYLPLVIGN